MLRMQKRRPFGSGLVYQPSYTAADKSLKYQATWWLAFHVNGKLVRESSGTTVKTEAEKLLRARTSAVDRGELGQAAAALHTTLADLATIVATDYKNNQRASWREVTRSFDRLKEHFGAGCLARSITASRVEEYKAARLKSDTRPATVNRELAMLRRGLRLGVRLGKVASRPEFSLLRESAPRAGFFDEAQRDALVAQLAADLRPVVLFMFWTGWRKGEVLSLEWRQVDRKTGSIRIERTKNAEPRTIPYGALPELKDLIDAQHKVAEALRRKGQIVPWVFHRDGEKVLDFMGAWKGACKRAGLAGKIPHDFRRTAARAMLRADIPQAVAMKIGGWKTDSVFRRYAIVDERLLAENLKKLSKRQA
jgi:integrase